MFKLLVTHLKFDRKQKFKRDLLKSKRRLPKVN